METTVTEEGKMGPVEKLVLFPGLLPEQNLHMMEPHSLRWQRAGIQRSIYIYIYNVTERV